MHLNSQFGLHCITAGHFTALVHSLSTQCREKILIKELQDTENFWCGIKKDTKQ